MKKITTAEEDMNRCLSIWVTDFDELDYLYAQANEVLRPHFEDVSFGWDDILEMSVHDEALSVDKLLNDLLWQVCDVATVSACAARLGVTKKHSILVLNHARCSAGPHDFTGFIFLGTFSSIENHDIIIKTSLEKINQRLNKHRERMNKHSERMNDIVEKLQELEQKLQEMEARKLDALDTRDVKSREERAEIFDQFLQDQEKLIPQSGESDDSDELDARLNLIVTRLAEVERIIRTQIR